MTQTILVLNSGSSSIKFRLFTDDESLTLLANGQVKAIGAHPVFEVTPAATKEKFTQVLVDGTTHESALRVVLEWIEKSGDGWVIASVGHRVVHGGANFREPVRVTPEVIKQLNDLSPLAPLHEPHNVAGMVLVEKIKPNLPQVACFDTAFHATQEPLLYRYAVPDSMLEKGVRRYGFHGLSYEWIARQMREQHPAVAKGRVLVAHLGAGASLCAMKDGKSVATTMGMTALEGLCMGTRCGTIDPGVLIFMMRDMHMTADDIERVLYKDSGLKGLSGGEPEVVELLKRTDDKARFAMDYFVMRVVQQVGMMVASMGGMDAIVFTGGIGENSEVVRQAIVQKMTFLPPFQTLVIPTNEEWVIANHVRGCLDQKRAVA